MYRFVLEKYEREHPYLSSPYIKSLDGHLVNESGVFVGLLGVRFTEDKADWHRFCVLVSETKFNKRLT